jgi:S1-C subfamily serine protease
MRLKNLLVIGIGLLSSSLGFAPRLVADELPDIIKKIKPAIVGIGTYQKTRTPAAVFRGTGFSVGDGLHILTNAHVLPEAVDKSKFETLAVFTRDGEKQTVRRAAEIAIDESHDIALLRIGGPPLPSMRLGDSSKVREGEPYAFTGYPIGTVLGLNPVTHRGIVSAISPIAIPAHTSQRLNAKMIRRLTDSYEVFQLDATAYPGNSGSPLYDPKSGEVVGIINKVFVQETKENLLERPSGISYAIPIKYALTLLNANGIKQ